MSFVPALLPQRSRNLEHGLANLYTSHANVTAKKRISILVLVANFVRISANFTQPMTPVSKHTTSLLHFLRTFCSAFWASSSTCRAGRCSSTATTTRSTPTRAAAPSTASPQGRGYSHMTSTKLNILPPSCLPKFCYRICIFR